MFKVKIERKLFYESKKFVGIVFAYEEKTYEIFAHGIEERYYTTPTPVFYLRQNRTSYIKVADFHEDVRQGKIKLIKNVGV